MISKGPRLAPIASPEETAASPDLPVDSGDPSNATRRGLLRPRLVEVAVPAADIAIILAAGVGSCAAYQWITTSKIGHLAAFLGVGMIVAANFAAIMAARRNYRLKNLTLLARQIRETFVIWSGVYGLLAAAAFTMKISAEFSRGAVILFFVGGLTALCSWRHVVATVISRFLANGSFARRKIIVIAERDQSVSSRALLELRRCGYEPVKTCEISTQEITFPGISASLRSKLAEIVQIARTEGIEDIYLLVGWSHHRVVDGILNALAVLPISVHLVPDENATRFLSYPITNIGSTWTAVLKRTPLTHLELVAKRCFDLVVTTAALVTLLPSMLVTAALIKLDSRGPVFFRQRRNGFNGQTFDIIKFRTMHVLEDGPAIRQATRNDPRVTRLGRWLRRSSIDELPQLFNVIRGDMSLVGPRPHATSHNSEYEKLIANYAYRHHVKPGLTGWAQVNGYRGETRHIEQMRLRVEHDLWYINNWSPWLDLRIVLQTIVVALRQTAAY